MNSTLYKACLKSVIHSRSCFFSSHRHCLNGYLRSSPLIDIFRLNIPHLRYHSIHIEDKLLTRPEVQEYLSLLTDFEHVDYSNTHHNQGSILNLIEEAKRLRNELKSLEKLSSDDKEIQELVKLEEEDFNSQIKEINMKLLLLALPEDPDDKRDAILQVIPGVGGDEAKLFAEEMFNMYVKYANFKQWEIWDSSPTSSEGGGIIKGELCLSGGSIYEWLKHESGIHRVQRVPATEKAGRAQTSTIIVHVIPQIEPSEILIQPKDIIMEARTSRGPGGQNVNKRETCIRIKHLPTGVVVESQEDRNQIRNRETAMRKLRNILHEMECKKTNSKLSDLKKSQAPNPERSQKVKTYNFLQNRVTDHKLNHSIFNLERYLEGNVVLDDMIALRQKQYIEERLLTNIKHIIKEKNLKELLSLART